MAYFTDGLRNFRYQPYEEPSLATQLMSDLDTPGSRNQSTQRIMKPTALRWIFGFQNFLQSTFIAATPYNFGITFTFLGTELEANYCYLIKKPWKGHNIKKNYEVRSNLNLFDQKTFKTSSWNDRVSQNSLLCAVTTNMRHVLAFCVYW